MSDVQPTAKDDAAKWPAGNDPGGAAPPPVTQASLANAAARAAASNARRDLVAYLRLRRKSA